jgi:GNAT superfamily N-acetyltransferase
MPCEGPVHLRRATVDDAAGIAHVHADGWRSAHVGLVPAEYLNCVGSRLREEFWREELEVASLHREPWLALLDDRVIGFASGGLARDEDADTSTAEIYQLFVDPECWSQGIRTNLVDHVLRDLKSHGFERVTFWVLAADAATRQFAEHLHWSSDGSSRFEDCGGTRVEQLRYAHLLR